ncbi:MAG TPA: enoyl-CoA hydratase/isomerase family protein [Blastocatellia bacterium]|nr:enoyl-CoA hydratase/isomerase family protein [Blastocatellia bacterium]
MAGASAILTDISGAIAVIRFDQPAKRNPLSSATLDELADAVSSLTAREDLKAIVFTGSEDVFASGADISELTELDSERAAEFSQFGQNVFQTIADARQVTIAAISGYCMGGALDLALACDIRIASPQAVFRHPGARLGIITGWGGTQRMPRLIGRARSLEFFLTTRWIKSEEALEIGLVSSISDDVLASAFATAGEIPQRNGAKPEDLAPPEK